MSFFHVPFDVKDPVNLGCRYQCVPQNDPLQSAPFHRFLTTTGVSLNHGDCIKVAVLVIKMVADKVWLLHQIYMVLLRNCTNNMLPNTVLNPTNLPYRNTEMFSK